MRVRGVTTTGTARRSAILPFFVASLLATLAYGCEPAFAQETTADTLRTEAIRLRGFIRAAETQGTKVLDLIDRLGPIAGDTTVHQDTLPPVQDTLPAVQDTIPFEVCPEGWTCTPPAEPDPDPAPPDTVAVPPSPLTGVVLAGFVASGGGLELSWASAPGNDSVRVVFALNKSPWTELGRVTVPGDSTRARLTPVPIDTTAAIFGCGVPFRDGIEGSSQCNRMTAWNPVESVGMGPGYFFNGLRIDGFDPDSVTQIAHGDTFTYSLDLVQRVDGELVSRWADGTETLPDSVVFNVVERAAGSTVRTLRHREQSYPFDLFGDGGAYVIPAVDTVWFRWEVHGCDLHAQVGCNVLKGANGLPFVDVNLSGSMDLRIISIE